jgi:hypothetical protein
LGARRDGADARASPQLLAEVRDPNDGGVRDRPPGHLVSRDAAQVRLKDPHGAAVRDDHDVPGVVVIGRRRELVDELGRPVVQIADGLAASRPRIRIGHPAVVEPGHGRPDRNRGDALEYAE